MTATEKNWTDVPLADIDDGIPQSPEGYACMEPGCTFVSDKASGLRRHQTRTHNYPPSENTVRARKDRPSEHLSASGATGGQDEGPREVPPRPPRPAASSKGVFGRWRARARGARKVNAVRKKVEHAGPRIPLAADITETWWQAGQFLESTPFYPSGRMLSYQAPTAGLIVDNALAGSAADRWLLQPAARMKEQYADVYYLTAPPVMLYMIQSIRLKGFAAQQAGDMATAAAADRRARALGRRLEFVLRTSLVRMAPHMAEARRRQEDEQRIIAEAFPELGPGEDPVQTLLSELFRPPGEDNINDGYGNPDNG